MTATEIARYRLINQQIAARRCKEPVEVVSSLGAMQAQDYLGTLWAIGLRLPAPTERDVERAIADRKIIRTWPLRGTLHFVAAADVHWLLELLGPRIISTANLRFEQYGLDSAALSRIRKVLVKALQGTQLTRVELYAVLERAKISVEGQRGYHILWRMGVDRTICFGARRGKQPTFTLLEEWVQAVRTLDQEAALAELAWRYFNSHGPATLRDFAWWSGLKMSDAKAGLAMVSSRLESLAVSDKIYWMNPETPSPESTASIAYLLPGFDEYLLGYRDRSAALDPAIVQKIQPGSNGIFSSTIVIDGKVVGTWKRELTKKAVTVSTNLFRAPSKREARALEEAIGWYCEYLGTTRGLKPSVRVRSSENG
ncbi:MAG: AlkZ family DNA glycosylase [Verrucomicrobia bacterium]|nr:AlkZ family DNA glycosylase [Verrucomicrobiota bacterium]MBV8276218.1 AlkZ family DNA glycosylase [Verrucomicrobiota bacterium]